MNLFKSLLNWFQGDQLDPETKVKQLIALLKTGNCYTVVQINKILHTTEARKFISILRQRGYKIDDVWRYSDDRKRKWKEYFLVSVK